MINRLHSLLHRPEKGWDPVDPAYALSYSEREWRAFTPNLLDTLEELLGERLNGKRILDLGGGPGQYSVAFARRGAMVTWHDVSRAYLQIARRHADDAGVQVEFSLGYLEDARRFVGCPFDLVFNRICWYYGMDDRGFASLIYSLVKPGGAAYVDTNTRDFEKLAGKRKLQYLLNDRFFFKVGHPHPPHGRVADLFGGYAVDRMILDYSSVGNDRVFFIKSKGRSIVR